ncbi:ApeA N-terminal domain 1-containing protein [Photobacterium leiognathi]|uniref:ApeA N-terminal domain 1-containing protein n=1 Tax=Photobacterium leiognathi TaxID=553611 RepID=UPI00298189A6|nr:HEPN domain-containing protein [Photobacterium leiognathi]
MTNKKYSAFEKYEFIGEFFASEDTYTTRFAGKIVYDIEVGLTLNFSIVDSDFPKKVDVLYGVLDNGQKCTLIGPFDFSRTGMRFGKINTRYGKKGFKFLVIGEFVELKQLYDHARFTFSHMQEFFYPQGWLDDVKYEDGIIEKIEGKNWYIEVENRATFSDVTDSLENLLLTNDDVVAKQIVESVNSILSNYESEHLLIRQSLEFLFKFQPSVPLEIGEIYNRLYRISSLFSIFMNIPTFPDEIKLCFDNNNSVHVLASQSLELRTVKLAKSSPCNHFMPINRSAIDLSNVLSKWLELYDSYQVLSTTFQHETNSRTLHAAYSDIILYLSNVESIASDLGKHKGSKYVAPIDEYASTELSSAFNTIFASVNTNDLGKNLSDLRNELAHAGKAKKLMKCLDIGDYVRVGSYLKLIVVSHLLEKLGLSRIIIHEYQRKLMR